MKCFIIVLRDFFELYNFKELLNVKNNIAEINDNGKILRFLIYEPKLEQKSFFELDNERKENKLSGIIILTVGFNIEKFIRNAKLFEYEIFVIKTKDIILPNNELFMEFKVKNFTEILNLISHL
ncbi:MAG: hypothetical protein ABIL89_02700 [candidate division WOR-3 bacterium]